MVEAERGLAALTALARAVPSASAPDAVVDALVAAARDGIGVGMVHLTEVSQDAAVGHARSVGFREEATVADEYVQVFDERPSGVGRVIASGEPLHVPDAVNSAELRQDYVQRFNARSLLFVPLVWGGEVRYVMVLIRHEQKPYDEDELRLAEALADLGAGAFARLEAERRTVDQHDRDAALARAAKALNASLELDTVLETLSREADLAVGGDMAGVYLGDGERGGTATAGHNTPAEWFGYVIKPGEGVGGQVLATGKPIISNAYQSDVQLPANPALRRIQTAVGVPMTWGGELRGALSIGFTRMRRIDDQDLRTLEAIADLASVACRNAETFQRIESATRRDSLTGLLDHGALHARLREEVARSRRDGTPLAVMLLDLDDFEALNAQAGHLHGDEVLARTAAVLRRALPQDALARYGGDEFVAILPGATLDGATAQADALRQAIFEHVAMPDGAPPLGTSFGVAAWEEPLEAAQLLDRALAAVREAKRAGKNRVSSATTAAGS